MSPHPLNILVFGRNGQVATELRRQARVTALGRAETDLSDHHAIADAIRRQRIDVLINAAAYTAVDKAEEEETQAQELNGAAPGVMAEVAAEEGIPFLHVSTDYVFPGDGTLPRGPTHMLAPCNAYGRTKLAGEQAVLQAGGNAAILRTSWVFSAHGNNFVKTMLRVSETRDALSVVSDQIGGPTPAAAIADALLTMAGAMADGQRGGIHHYSGAPDVSWADFARVVFDRAGRQVHVVDIPTSAYPTPAARPLNCRLDCSTLEEDFGISRPDWYAGLDAVLKELTP